ncbi:helix-turn-helix domain-containing protein [Streptomyces sp. NPDC021225]|uniref:helix-turn-helix domain-containing protein n=1 Tax=Streptomyces sp. NPDC021225 TaxID=3365121 RepID=UPI003788F25D
MRRRPDAPRPRSARSWTTHTPRSASRRGEHWLALGVRPRSRPRCRWHPRSRGDRSGAPRGAADRPGRDGGRCRRLRQRSPTGRPASHGRGGRLVLPGQAVYDRRTALGIDQASLAERTGLSTEDIDRLEGGGTMPTLPLLRTLAKALDAALDVSIDTEETRVSFVPHAA